jgi:hypothetical protein
MKLPRLPVWLFALFMAGFVLFDLAWFGPWLQPWLDKRRLLTNVAAADVLYEAMGTALHDHQRQAALGLPWPAESGLKTTRQYLDRLVVLHYLTEKERSACGGLVIANVGARDPSDTLLFASRNVYERLIRKRSGDASDRYVLYRKSGEGDVALEIPRRENLPPRLPAFLAP